MQTDVERKWQSSLQRASPSVGLSVDPLAGQKLYIHPSISIPSICCAASSNFIAPTSDGIWSRFATIAEMLLWQVEHRFISPSCYIRHHPAIYLPLHLLFAVSTLTTHLSNARSGRQTGSRSVRSVRLLSNRHRHRHHHYHSCHVRDFPLGRLSRHLRANFSIDCSRRQSPHDTCNTKGRSTLSTCRLSTCRLYYRHQGSHVFCCFIVFSKEFDYVDYWLLFCKLLDYVIGHVTIRLAIGHFLSVVLWNQASISNGFRDIQWQMWRMVDMTLNDL